MIKTIIAAITEIECSSPDRSGGVLATFDRVGIGANKALKLATFRSLIASMPVSHQSFVSKRSTWISHVGNNDVGGNALNSIFGTSDKVNISRDDLRCLGRKPDLAEFVMATIIWGYPSGMRGNHFSNLIYHIGPLAQLLSIARNQPLADWESHYSRVRPLAGLGLSTYTKFLNFLSVQVQGNSALILDDRIIRISNQYIFEALGSLQRLSYDRAPSFCPQYLECIQSLARRLEVSAENIEFFLFEFGLNLKPPSPINRSN